MRFIRAFGSRRRLPRSLQTRKNHDARHRTLQIENLESRTLLTAVPAFGVELARNIGASTDRIDLEARIGTIVTGRDVLRVADIPIARGAGRVDGGGNGHFSDHAHEAAPPIEISSEPTANITDGEQTLAVSIDRWREAVDTVYETTQSVVPENELAESLPTALDELAVDGNIDVAGVLNDGDFDAVGIDPLAEGTSTAPISAAAPTELTVNETTDPGDAIE